MTNPFAGRPLRYEIANDDAQAVAGEILEPGYSPPGRPPGIVLRYSNTRDQVSPLAMRQRNEGHYGPYLKPDDISDDYPEPAPVARSPGAWRLIVGQIDAAKGWDGIEWDNIDTYDSDYALAIFDRTWVRGLAVAVKNPLNVEGDPGALIKHAASQIVIVEKGVGSPAEMFALLKAANKFIPVRYVAREGEREWADDIAAEIKRGEYPDFAVTWSTKGEYGAVEHVLLPTPAVQQPQTPSSSMAYSLTWLPDVLRAAGLKVVETDGWQTRGHGDMGTAKGIVCHHTNGAKTGNMPTLPVLIDGRSDLPGPLAQLGLARDGTYYMVGAGLCYHAGPGGWKGLSGNGSVIGIEAENVGDHIDPWPAVQMDAYRRGCAAIAQHLGFGADMVCGHKEWTSRKDDPTFDMNQFRRDVATLMSGGTIAPLPDTPENRPVLGKGNSGAWVETLQKLVGVSVDGDFGSDTDAAVRTYQATRGLTVDGLVGRDTWAALMAGAPATQPAPTNSGKGSWYSQYRGKYVWIDNGDAPGSAALGVPDDAQGIALYDRSTLGSWFAVTAPNGVTSIEQQTDIGPHPNTGRLIDIAAAAAERFGYAPTNFPTDRVFTWRPVPPPSAVASLTPQQQAVKWRDLRKTAAPDPVTPVPQPEPQPMPDAALAQILSALTNLDARLTRIEQTPAPSLPAAGGPDWVEIVTSVGGVMQKLPHVVATVDDLMDRVPQIIAAGERVAGLIERFGPLIGLLTGGRTGLASLPAAPPVLIQPPAATSLPTPAPAASSGPGVGFWPGLLTVIGSAIAALNGVDPHLAASIAAPGVGLMGASAIKATPKDYASIAQRLVKPPPS